VWLQQFWRREEENTVQQDAMYLLSVRWMLHYYYCYITVSRADVPHGPMA
jgi:hypothetical protein